MNLLVSSGPALLLPVPIVKPRVRLGSTCDLRRPAYSQAKLLNRIVRFSGERWRISTNFQRRSKMCFFVNFVPFCENSGFRSPPSSFDFRSCGHRGRNQISPKTRVYLFTSFLTPGQQMSNPPCHDRLIMKKKNRARTLIPNPPLPPMILLLARPILDHTPFVPISGRAGT